MNLAYESYLAGTGFENNFSDSQNSAPAISCAGRGHFSQYRRTKSKSVKMVVVVLAKRWQFYVW